MAEIIKYGVKELADFFKEVIVNNGKKNRY
jgi:hypothetical protein